MFTLLNRALYIATIVLTLSIVSFPSSGNAMEEQAFRSGSVTIANMTGHVVIIEVRNVDFSGKISWNYIDEIQPDYLLELPKVPAGAIFRAKALNDDQRPIYEWEFEVKYYSSSKFSVQLRLPEN